METVPLQWREACGTLEGSKNSGQASARYFSTITVLERKTHDKTINH